ncbi:MAG: PKD domain-containing protein, partial [Bacteroidota bacterium]|nr:PKD domain-containing protein [Bacteroidota bacterium]
MKKLVTTGFQGSLWLVLAMSLSFQVSISSTLSAQQGCVMSCPPNSPPLQISVSADCADQLTYQILGVTLSGCSGEVVIDIMENGNSLGDSITYEMVGNTYMVVVSIPSENQSCMLVIMVVDKQAPILNCPDDVTLPCTTDLSLYNALLPGDISDCGTTTVSIIDILLAYGICEDNIISQYGRMYIVVDQYNNADTCEQLISLEKASLDDVDFPPDLIGVNALACFPLPDTSAANTGIPSVGGNPITNGIFCNLIATKTDFIVPLCSGSYKILRTWRVYDSCEGNVFIDSTQIIEVADITGPVVVAPADMTFSTSGSDCFADVIIPPALITEDCSATWTVRIQGPFGTIEGNGGLIQNLPVGIYTITFIATNACNLTGQDQMIVTIQDLIPPIPVCHQHLVVPLNHVGTALIPAAAFNAASTDNCGNTYFKVRRMNAPAGYSCSNPGNPNNMFDDHVMFCCEDIANNNIMVVLRVYDLPPVAGPVGATYLQGHYNDCMIEVEIQDKLAPSISCPDDLTISCIFPFTEENLGVLGTVATSPADQHQICINDPGLPGNPGPQCLWLDGLATDNCHVEITSSAVIDINMCGVGIIVRTFTATDDGGLQSTCQQTITVVNYDLFDEGDITWPLDYTTNNICEISLLDPEDLEPPYNVPILNDGTCDLTAATHEDEVFDLTNNDQACFKILRTWTVIDWCQLNSKAGGQWTHTQIIKVMNNIAPVIEPIEDVTECSFDEECEGLTLSFEATASDDCSLGASLRWRYFIDLDTNQTFDFTSTVLPGATITFTRELPIGTHRILYSVWDQCGNTSSTEQLVTIESCTPPSAVCIHGLSTNLMAMDLDGDGSADWGMVTLQAEMFDASSSQSCGNEFTLAFSSDPLDVSRVFDCSDLGVNEIELWAIDENGLTDFCVTEVEIQDNNGICPEELGGSGTISGNITVPNSGKLSGAMIYLDGSNLPGIASGSNGYFVFPTMPFGGIYKVRPTYDGNARNGVSAIDLVKIQKHLLG